MSSPRRTTFLFGSKESDARIAYNSREKEDSLSLKKSNFKATAYFSFFSPTFSFPFLISFSHHFFFSFLFLFLFHFLLISSFHFLLLFGAHHTSVKGGNFLPFSSNHLCGYQFSIPFLLFLYDIITYMAQCEPWNHFPHMANCEPLL